MQMLSQKHSYDEEKKKVPSCLYANMAAKHKHTDTQMDSIMSIAQLC